MTTRPRHDVSLVAQAAELPRAAPSSVTAPFWEACRRSRLLYQRCGRCRAVTFPPAELCRECLARDQRWERSAGRGLLYSWTVVHRPVTPAFAAPYAPAIVTLTEGYQMLTNIVNATPGQLRLDLPVRVTFVEVGGGLVLPYFEPDPGRAPDGQPPREFTTSRRTERAADEEGRPHPHQRR